VKRIYGKQPVLEALRSGRRIIEKVLLQESPHHKPFREILTLCREKGVEVEFASRKRLGGLVGTEKHQGVVALTCPLRDIGLRELLLEAAERSEPAFLVALDGIEDPHNLGAILRTAEAAGVHGVIIPKRRSAKPGATVAKTSAGALEYVPLVMVTNLAAALEELKSLGIWVAGVTAEGTKAYFEADFKGAIALVVGGEGRGLRPKIKDSCDFLVSIPQWGRLSSLNASVAAALVIYEAARQRYCISC